ncbi:MAG: SMP-30/gluconolactonase/LRE family protein, partial [Bryobacteraceae bacterium]
MAGCGTPSGQEEAAKAPSEAPAAVQEIVAEQIATDGSWGNTEGPAIDSKGNLYFCSRGTYKGIVRWNEKEGAQRYLAVATKAGPGGLWIDDDDNIFVTATDERKILKVTPGKKVTTVAEKFEEDPKLAKGPNDLVVASNGTIYFTDPKGYEGEAPNGTIYRVDPKGKTTVFSNEITGPNGIILSLDEKTLYVSHNVAKSTSKIERWPLNADGSAGAMAEVATVNDCMADGMAIDREGALWLTCYSFGAAYRLTPDGTVTHKITTEQKALTNAKFGRGTDNNHLYLTSSDMARVTGYIYRAEVPVPGTR